MFKYPFNQKVNLPNPRELTPEQIVEIRTRWLEQYNYYSHLHTINNIKKDEDFLQN